MSEKQGCVDELRWHAFGEAVLWVLEGETDFGGHINLQPSVLYEKRLPGAATAAGDPRV